jgi:hypothetical protein
MNLTCDPLAIGEKGRRILIDLGLIGRRFLDLIDDEYLERPSGRFQR